MSVTSAQALLQRLNDDVDFRAQVEAAESQPEKQAIIEAAGYLDVTQEDILAAAPTMGFELTDAELEAVAGGRTVEWVAAIATCVGAGAAAAAA